MTKNHKKLGKKRLASYLKKHRWYVAGLVLLLIFYAQYMALSSWYINRHKTEPLEIGATFIPNYAEDLGMNPQDTLDAIINDLGIKRFRLVSYWKDIEKSPGVYDFSRLDWQIEKIRQINGDVSLAVGLRQPRWPECHAPPWTDGMSREEWYPKLKDYMAATINHVKSNSTVKSYQLENEYFLGVFGDCQKYGTDRERLIEEFQLIKSLDGDRPIIISLSNNYLGLPIGDPRPDKFGISLYRRNWDATITKRYVTYPFPPRYYTWRSALTEIATGRDSMLHELQAEPWGPGELKHLTVEEQDKSMSAKDIPDRLDFALKTGYRQIDIWGVEWWYWRKVNGDPSLWNSAILEMRHLNQKR